MENGSLKPRIIQSDDGSHTLRVDGLNENYHSHKGAVRESYHVFLRMGLDFLKSRTELELLEVGFGTGLNALLTAIEPVNCHINYTTLEPLPLDWELIQQLNYPDHIATGNAHQLFSDIHQAPWEQAVEITSKFTITKQMTKLQDYLPGRKFDLVYYDAFAPHAQPELWSVDVWERMFGWMADGAILVTYCAKGQVRRDMQSVGFKVERLEGPPGKREMLRAMKP